MGAVVGISQTVDGIDALVKRLRSNPRLIVTPDCVLTTSGSFQPFPLAPGFKASQNPHQIGLHVKVESIGTL